MNMSKMILKGKLFTAVNPTTQQSRMGTCVLSIITSSVGQTAWFHQLDFSLSNRIYLNPLVSCITVALYSEKKVGMGNS